MEEKNGIIYPKPIRSLSIIVPHIEQYTFSPIFTPFPWVIFFLQLITQHFFISFIEYSLSLFFLSFDFNFASSTFSSSDYTNEIISEIITKTKGQVNNSKVLIKSILI